MAELRQSWMEVHEVVEVARGGGELVHGRFTSPEEAERRYVEVVKADPVAAGAMAISLRVRRLEVLSPPVPPGPPAEAPAR